MTRIESLINFLQKDGFNFEYDSEYKTLNVYFKKGYISIGKGATKKAFMDLYEAYIMGNRNMPGIVWIM